MRRVEEAGGGQFFCGAVGFKRPRGSHVTSSPLFPGWCLQLLPCILFTIRIQSFPPPHQLSPLAYQKHVAAFPAGAPRRPCRPIITPTTCHNPVFCARALPAQVGGYERQLAHVALSQGRLWEPPSPARRRRVGGLAGLCGM